MAKPPGRPRESEQPFISSVTAWLPVAEHDRLVKVAAKRGESLSATIRDILRTKNTVTFSDR